MRIAWITYDFEEYSVLQVNELAREHEVLLVMPEGVEAKYPLHPNVKHFAFRKPRLRQPVRQLQSVRSILGSVRKFQPDVVHFQQGHMWFNAALSSLRRYPLVITIHDPRHHEGDVVSRKTPQWLMDYGFRQADHVIVHGDALAVQVQKLFGKEREQVHVIPHVAMGSTSSDTVEPEDENLVLFFGRIWDYKGLDQLIAAEPLIAEAHPHVRIMIAGEGDDFSKYQAMMKNPHRFLVRNSWISDHQRARLFQRSALVVLPYNEATQSGVVPVAYNFSKPVVATRVGALAECVEDGVTGILIPPKNPQAIADAVVKLLKDPVLRRQMGHAGRKRLKQQCAPEVVAAQTADVYRAAIASKSRIFPRQTSVANEITTYSTTTGGS